MITYLKRKSVRAFLRLSLVINRFLQAFLLLHCGIERAGSFCHIEDAQSCSEWIFNDRAFSDGNVERCYKHVASLFGHVLYSGDNIINQVIDFY